MVLRVFRTGAERLVRYLTLPAGCLVGRIWAGLFNVLLAVPSLVSPVVARIYDSVCRVLAERCTVNFYGFRVRSSDCEGMLMFHPLYERRVTHVLLSLLSEGAVFIDVGAHFGRYTLMASRVVGSRGLVVALEPVPESFAVLRHNVESNGLGNVVVLPFAAWSNDTVLEFVVPPGRSGASAVGVRHFTGLPLSGHIVRVHAFSLDTLVFNVLKLERVDVVKIDVEGAEAEVIKGARRVLEVFKPRLIVEVRPSTRQAIRDFMSSLGYSEYDIDKGNKLYYLA